MLEIPKKIHAIWLGRPIRDIGKDNLANWKRVNDDYEVNLWIDSALYHDEDIEAIAEMHNWAAENNIIINDLNLQAANSDAHIKGQAELYNQLLNKDFYDDEINGNYPNYAAASDILRIEILKKYGGIYIDAEDVFPNNPLETISTEYGFLIHIESQLNNDILASVANGTLINDYNSLIHEKYKDLYENKLLLDAHRNSAYSRPEFYAGDNARLFSTVETSGPGAVMFMLLVAQDKILPETKTSINDFYQNSLKLTFPPKHYQLPKQQALSWFEQENKENSTQNYIKIRSYIRSYFTNQLSLQIDKLEQMLHNENSKMFFNKDNKKITQLSVVIKNINEIKNKLNLLAPTHPTTEMLLLAEYGLDDSSIHSMNQYSNNLLFKIEKSFNSLEQLIQDDKIEPLSLYNATQKMTNFSDHDETEKFINAILNNSQGIPDYAQLENFGLIVNEKIAKNKMLP